MSKSYKERLREFAEDMKQSYTGKDYNNSYDKIIESVIKEESFDSVERPYHYNQGGIETIDYMKAYSTKEEYQGHCRLTALKYLSRFGNKVNSLEDMKKSRWYLNKLIESMEG